MEKKNTEAFKWFAPDKRPVEQRKGFVFQASFFRGELLNFGDYISLFFDPWNFLGFLWTWFCWYLTCGISFSPKFITIWWQTSILGATPYGNSSSKDWILGGSSQDFFQWLKAWSNGDLEDTTSRLESEVTPSKLDAAFLTPWVSDDGSDDRITELNVMEEPIVWHNCIRIYICNHLSFADWRALRPGPYPSSTEQKKQRLLSKKQRLLSVINNHVVFVP